jgi:hypothetical protein
MYIYVILAENGLFKIGKATDIISRLKGICYSCPIVCYPIAYKQYDTKVINLEFVMHEKFQNKRVRGEWFALTKEDLAYIFNSDAIWINEIHEIDDFYFDKGLVELNRTEGYRYKSKEKANKKFRFTKFHKHLLSLVYLCGENIPVYKALERCSKIPINHYKLSENGAYNLLKNLYYQDRYFIQVGDLNYDTRLSLTEEGLIIGKNNLSKLKQYIKQKTIEEIEYSFSCEAVCNEDEYLDRELDKAKTLKDKLLVINRFYSVKRLLKPQTMPTSHYLPSLVSSA